MKVSLHGQFKWREPVLGLLVVCYKAPGLNLSPVVHIAGGLGPFAFSVILYPNPRR